MGSIFLMKFYNFLIFFRHTFEIITKKIAYLLDSMEKIQTLSVKNLHAKSYDENFLSSYVFFLSLLSFKFLAAFLLQLPPYKVFEFQACLTLLNENLRQ